MGRSIYGTGTDEANPFTWPRTVAPPPEQSLTGNVILRIGQQERAGEGWHQVAHLVLTPDEAREYVAAIGELLPGGDVAPGVEAVEERKTLDAARERSMENRDDEADQVARYLNERPTSPEEVPVPQPLRWDLGDVVRHSDSPDDRDNAAVVVARAPTGQVDLIAPGAEGVGLERIDGANAADLRQAHATPKRDVVEMADEILEDEGGLMSDPDVDIGPEWSFGGGGAH